MNDYRPPFIIESDPFLDAYIEALQALEAVGILIEFKQRIPIFQIYNKLNAMEPSDDVEQAQYAVEVLKELMIRGLEPEHKQGRYA